MRCATAGSGGLATVPQVGEPTYAAKITAADRVLDAARPARELHDRVRALSPHIGARLALDGAPHTIWRTRVASDGPARGEAGARRRRTRARHRRRGARAVRAPAARRSPDARGRLAARPARRTAGGDGRVSDARTLALRVLTRVFDEGAYADRAFSGEAEQGTRRRARARTRDAPRLRRGAAAAHAGCGARGDRGTPGAAAGAPPRARPAARRLPDPVRRRNPATCSGFGERGAGAPRDRRTRHRARERRAAAHRRRGPGVVRGAARGDARGRRAAALAARLDRRAVVRRLRRAAGPRAVRRGQPRAGAVALAEPAARRRGRGRGVAARGRRGGRPRRRHRRPARGRPARRRRLGGLQERRGGAHRPRSRPGGRARRSEARHAGARPLRGAGRQDRGAGSERRPA